MTARLVALEAYTDLERPAVSILVDRMTGETLAAGLDLLALCDGPPPWFRTTSRWIGGAADPQRSPGEGSLWLTGFSGRASSTIADAGTTALAGHPLPCSMASHQQRLEQGLGFTPRTGGRERATRCRGRLVPCTTRAS